MTALNRQAAGLGEYGDEPNDNGATPADAPESPENDEDAAAGGSPDGEPVVAPAVEGGGTG